MAIPLIKTIPPRARTILYCRNSFEECACLRFSFPELTFVVNRLRTIFLTIRIGDLYCPFRFFNVRKDGSICFPGGEIIRYINSEVVVNPAMMKEVVDFFWNTNFNISATPGLGFGDEYLPVNKKIGWISFLQWKNMTHDDPNFMSREFDPEYYSFERRPKKMLSETDISHTSWKD